MEAKTRVLLNEGSRSNKQISDDLEIPIDWIARFRTGRAKHPEIRLVKCLHSYLYREYKFRLKQKCKCGEAKK